MKAWSAGRSATTNSRSTADGRIRIRGPQVMAGYLDGSGVDPDGWLTTGDLGKIDAKGRLTVTGRADDMLISGGRNVHPLEVESCLAACPGIRDVAVTGLRGQGLGRPRRRAGGRRCHGARHRRLVPATPAGRRAAATHRSPGQSAA